MKFGKTFITSKYQRLIGTLAFASVLAFGIYSSKNSFSFDGDEARMAVFIYKIADYVENKGDVCYYGYDGVVNNFKLNKIPVVEIKENIDSKNKCKIIYIAQSEEKYVKTLTTEFNKNKLVSISLIDNFLESDGTIFIGAGRRGGLEINLNNNNIDRYKLKLNPIIFNIAKSKKQDR